MILLADLLEKIDYKISNGDNSIEINHLTTDSRKVEEGDLFVCIGGANFDGHRFIEAVRDKGAKAVVVEKSINELINDYGISEEVLRDITVVEVESTKYALAYISAAYFGYPAQKLKTIGITGTKGKTTTAYMVYEVLNKAGIETGLIGTIETIMKDEKIPSINTTPDSYRLQETFAKMVEKGIEAVVMEVSSQGLMLHRVGGFEFDYGVFTNLGKDHIGENEHKDFEDYKRCKAMLFKQCRLGIINADDSNARDMIAGATCKIETFAIKESANLKAENVKLYKEAGVLGIEYTLNIDKDKYPLRIEMPGIFNVYNSLTAIAICRHFTKDMKLIENALKTVRIKGRAELVPVSDKFSVMIDYAHNAMSLESLLLSIREYKPKRIVTVFGCGGNRDRNRRFEMGEVSSDMSDLTIITSDNPRHEKPEDIIEDIITGVKRSEGEYKTIVERPKAIEYAIKNAMSGDIIIIAGKGHEDYQIIGDTKYHMDDKELVIEAAKKLI